MSEKSKPIVIGVAVTLIVLVCAIFLHSKMTGGDESKAVIVNPANSDPSTQRPNTAAPVSNSAN